MGVGKNNNKKIGTSIFLKVGWIFFTKQKQDKQEKR
jgi:hypothetical protein